MYISGIILQQILLVATNFRPGRRIRLVLEQSCKVLQSWDEKYPGNALSISVNLSARQFSSLDLVQNLFDCLRRNRINPLQLKLEVTESDVMTNPEATHLETPTHEGDGDCHSGR
jgi:predicted signal transduction protein with EAL and GGDEF domain